MENSDDHEWYLCDKKQITVRLVQGVEDSDDHEWFPCGKEHLYLTSGAGCGVR